MVVCSGTKWLNSRGAQISFNRNSHWMTNKLNHLYKYVFWTCLKGRQGAEDSCSFRVWNQIATRNFFEVSNFETLTWVHTGLLNWHVWQTHETSREVLIANCQLGKIWEPKVIILLLHFLCGQHWSSWSWKDQYHRCPEAAIVGDLLVAPHNNERSQVYS